MPYDPASTFLHVYPREMKMCSHTKSCTWMFTTSCSWGMANARLCAHAAEWHSEIKRDRQMTDALSHLGPSPGHCDEWKQPVSQGYRKPGDPIYTMISKVRWWRQTAGWHGLGWGRVRLKLKEQPRNLPCADGAVSHPDLAVAQIYHQKKLPRTVYTTTGVCRNWYNPNEVRNLLNRSVPTSTSWFWQKPVFTVIT